jgi:hypothetical protein
MPTNTDKIRAAQVAGLAVVADTPDNGPSRAPDIRVGDREPITDGGRVMWGLERVVDYNSSPDMCGASWQVVLAVLQGPHPETGRS